MDQEHTNPPEEGIKLINPVNLTDVYRPEDTIVKSSVYPNTYTTMAQDEIDKNRPGIEGEEFKVKFTEGIFNEINKNPTYSTFYKLTLKQIEEIFAEQFESKMLWGSSPSKPKEIETPKIDPYDY